MSYQSDHINELASALAKAQGEFPKIQKTKVVDFTNKDGKRTHYNYADLADVIESIKPVLAKHGLAHSQDIRIEEHGKITLWTTIMHSSGQWKKGNFPINLGSKPQETGSAITYARRYTLCSALGIQADDDDDGEIAPENPKGNGKIKEECKGWAIGNHEDQVIQQLITALNYSPNQIEKLCKDKFKKSYKQLSQAEYEQIKKRLNELLLNKNKGVKK